MQNDEGDLPAVFSDLVRAQIELWNGIDADLRESAGLSLASVESLRAIETRLRAAAGAGAGAGAEPALPARAASTTSRPTS